MAGTTAPTKRGRGRKRLCKTVSRRVCARSVAKLEPFCVFFLLAPSFHFACQFGAAHPDGNLGRPSVRLLAVGMFLWWTKKVDGSDDTIEDKQHEINELKHELTTATLTRPSPISSRYGKCGDRGEPSHRDAGAR